MKNDFIKSKNATTTAKNKIDSNKVAKIIIAVLMAIWTIASIFTFGMSIENCTTAKADTVESSYNYFGSNVNIPIVPSYFHEQGQSTADDYKHGTISFALNLNSLSSQTIQNLPAGSNHYQMSYKVGAYYTNDFTENGLESVGQSYRYYTNLFAYHGLSPNYQRAGAGSHQLRYFTTRSNLWFSTYKTAGNQYEFSVTPLIKAFAFLSNSQFTANVVKIVIGNYDMNYAEYHNLYPNDIVPVYYKFFDSSNYYVCFNYIRYYDNNNNYLQIEFPAPTTAVNGGGDIVKNGFVRLQDRTYYTDNYLQSNTIFNDGLDVGYTQGKTEGIEQGRQEGYNNGFRVGKAEGYNEGVNDSNTYTFSSLLSSVIDVPLNAFRSLFNFEFLGINLTSFFLSLFTVALIIIVVRLII